MKRKLLQKGLGIFVTLLTLLVFGASSAQAQDLNKLATELAERIRALKLDRVTVADFVDLDKKPNKLGKFLTQKLQSALADPKHGLSVVDQSQLPQLFDQIEKLNEGLLDPATGKQLGKITGVEVVIVGTVMVSSMSVKLDVKAIDLQTAKLITGESDSISRIGFNPVDKLAQEVEGGGMEIASDADGMGSRSSSAPKPAVKPKTLPRSRHDQGVLFELAGCSLSGNALTCALAVTSEGRDRTLGISLDSRAWNDAGDEHGTGEAMIANSKVQRRYDRCIVKQLLEDVPTPLILTFSDFGDESSIVERLRVLWKEDDNCYDPLRSMDFEKIAMSNDDFSSPRTAARPGGGRGDAAGGQGKGGGGFLKRVTGSVLGIIESTAEKVIEKKTKEVLGDDEEEEEDKKPPQR